MKEPLLSSVYQTIVVSKEEVENQILISANSYESFKLYYSFSKENGDKFLSNFKYVQALIKLHSNCCSTLWSPVHLPVKIQFDKDILTSSVGEEPNSMHDKFKPITG